MRSLFVVSLPRSASTAIYHLARTALRLAEPIWTSDGEILNNDRMALYGGLAYDESEKFLTPHRTPLKFRRALAFARDVTKPDGYAYKDVVNPFLVGAYLTETPGPVLRVRRHPADVAWVMIEKRWYYPSRVSEHPGSSDRAMVEGLVRAEQALASLQAEVLDFDEFLVDEEALRSKLSALYPQVDIPQVRYIDGPFRQKRERLLEWRRTDRYRRLLGLFDEVEHKGTTWSD